MKGALAMACMAGATWLATAGCENPPPQPDTPPATRPAATRPAAKTGDAEPNIASGRVLGGDGKPINLAGRRAVITVSGSADGVTRQFRATADNDGRYSVKLDPGPYEWPRGFIEFSFRENQYRMPLTPLRTPRESFAMAHEGIQMDFAWKLSGTRPGISEGIDNADARIGGTIFPEFQLVRPDQNRTVPAPPLGTVVVFTLTPKGPLADGSEGKPTDYTLAFDDTRISLKPSTISDVPLGYYEIRGIERLPDGRTGKLLFAQSDGTWAETVEGTFQPDFKLGLLRRIGIRFTRKME
jgi:hypothetical protein